MGWARTEAVREQAEVDDEFLYFLIAVVGVLLRYSRVGARC
jgi:hypothetical protein